MNTHTMYRRCVRESHAWSLYFINQRLSTKLQPLSAALPPDRIPGPAAGPGVSALAARGQWGRPLPSLALTSEHVVFESSLLVTCQRDSEHNTLRGSKIFRAGPSLSRPGPTPAFGRRGGDVVSAGETDGP